MPPRAQSIEHFTMRLQSDTWSRDWTRRLAERGWRARSNARAKSIGCGGAECLRLPFEDSTMRCPAGKLTFGAHLDAVLKGRSLR
jgi:hypothetical protein